MPTTERTPLLPTHNLPRLDTSTGRRRSTLSPSSPQRRWRIPPPPPEPEPPKPRLRSLDLLRGGSLFTMLIVNTSVSGAFYQLHHSPFLTKQITFADTIFPTFLLCAGFSASISKPSMEKLCRRTIYLAGLGLVYNSVAALLSDRPIRFPGVLQRIALSSFVNAVQPFWTWLFPFVVTGVWWYTSIRFYNKDCAALEGVEGWFSPPNCTAQTTIDYMAVGKEHMYSPDYDPEGLLSTVTTAAVTVCAGTLISTYLLPLHHKYCVSSTSTLRTRIAFYFILLLSAVALITPLPYLLTPFIPMSKPLWTPPFLIQTIGVTLLSWLLASLIDIYPSIPGTKLIEAMGRRSLEVYLAAEILQEFVMYPGKRRGGGLWEGVVRLIMGVGVAREWSCLFVSFCWAGLFAGFGWVLDWMGWRIKL